MKKCNRCDEKFDDKFLNVGVCSECLDTSEKREIMENIDTKYVLKDQLGKVYTVRRGLKFSDKEINKLPTKKQLAQYEMKVK